MPSAARTGWAALGSLAIGALGALPALAGNEPSLAEIVNRAGAYVRQFDQDFAVVLSDERYDQSQFLNQRVTRRKMTSEMLFMWVPEEHAWLTVRNVLTVDQTAIPDSRERLERTLADPRPNTLTRLRLLADEGARFNLGRIYRNFNDATLALRFLEPAQQPRFTYTMAGQEKMNGSAVWKITFAEHALPTVISLDGENWPSAGVAWVGADGVVMRTALTLVDPKTNTHASIVVSYRRDPKLDMWVPGRMEETYTRVAPGRLSPQQVRMISERITCVAIYSSFRRFETSGRIVSPK